MPSEKGRIVEFNQHMKSDEMPIWAFDHSENKHTLKK